MIAWHQYLLGILLVLAGMNHFRKPKLYEKMLPPTFPALSTIILLSGIAEMILGFMLMNVGTQQQAAWGAIFLLIIYFLVHIYILMNRKNYPKLPKWTLFLSMPIHVFLIVWAANYI